MYPELLVATTSVYGNILKVDDSTKKIRKSYRELLLEVHNG